MAIGSRCRRVRFGGTRPNDYRRIRGPLQRWEPELKNFRDFTSARFGTPAIHSSVMLRAAAKVEPSGVIMAWNRVRPLYASVVAEP